jgi:hypothetical protein
MSGTNNKDGAAKLLERLQPVKALIDLLKASQQKPLQGRAARLSAAEHKEEIK